MKNNSILNDNRNPQMQLANENSRNSDGLATEIHVAVVKSYIDSYDHEKIRRQRQDLYDNWEQQGKKIIRQNK